MYLYVKFWRVIFIFLTCVVYEVIVYVYIVSYCMVVGPVLNVYKRVLYILYKETNSERVNILEKNKCWQYQKATTKTYSISFSCCCALYWTAALWFTIHTYHGQIDWGGGGGGGTISTYPPPPFLLLKTNHANLKCTQHEYASFIMEDQKSNWKLWWLLFPPYSSACLRFWRNRALPTFYYKLNLPMINRTLLNNCLPVFLQQIICIHIKWD